MRESRLSQLLLSLFDAGELRRFIRYRHPTLESWLPGPTASAAALAFEAVQALQRAGAIDRELFRALIEERPRRADEIRAVQRLWSDDAPPAAPQPAPPPVPAAGQPAFEYDIFLAYPSPDVDAATRLCDQLVGSDPEVKVFFDRRSLMLGDAWDLVIPAALRSSRVIVVLVSDRIDKAWYTRTEVHEAIALAREPVRGQRVVPVFLDGRPGMDSPIPYGLRQVQGLVLPEVGLGAASDQLLRLVRQLRKT
jgi:hypothetical protein